MNNFLILFGCASYRQGPRAIAQAQAIGLGVMLVDTQENLERLAATSPQSVSTWAVKSKEYNDCLPQIKSLCAAYPVVGIYTFEEYSVETCSRLCEALGFINNTPEAILRIRHKHLCRELLTQHGLPQPASRIFHSLEQAILFLDKENDGDCILKPVDASGSQGVSRIAHNSLPDLLSAFYRLTPRQQQAFIIEQFIDGQEFSLEGFFHHGQAIFLGITEKNLKVGNSFVEDMHIFPAPLAEKIRADVYTLAEKALQCVGLNFGHFHLEFWLSGGEIIIGEIHGRPGGDYIHLLTEIATGIPTYEAVFRQYLTHDPAPAVAYRCAAAVKYFDAPQGELTAINGLAELQQNKQILLTDITVKPGDILSGCSESSQRVGCVVVHEENSDKARQLAMEMAARVHFDVI